MNFLPFMSGVGDMSGAHGALGFIALILCFFLIVFSLLSIMLLVARCLIFKKANVQWWKALIPYYNTYCYFKISGLSEFICSLSVAVPLAEVIISSASKLQNVSSVSGIISNTAVVFFPILSMFGSSEASNLLGPVFAIIHFALLITNLVLQIKLCANLPKRFGKSGLFGVGLFFLPFIFYPILAFGKCEYVALADKNDEENSNK